MKTPEAYMTIFLSQDYVQVSNFSHPGKIETFLREETTNGVKWHISAGKEIFDEIINKDALKKLDKLWEERFWVGKE